MVAGHDFHETFAPTAKFKSICIVLNLAAIFGWDIHGLDIENAFIEETIYMQLPIDTYSESDGKPVIVKLKKSLYGLKQADELFYKLMKRILTSVELGMKCCIHDMCVFTWNDIETHEKAIVLLWVDDIIIDHIIAHIDQNVTKLNDLGEISRYIGMDIKRDRTNHTLELTQVPFTKSVINKLGPNLKSAKVPLNPFLAYRVPNTDSVNPPLHAELGSLRYLADRTKPTLQFPISVLQSGAINPTQVQIDDIKHVIRYLTGSIHDGLTFARGLESEPLVELFGMCDASISFRAVLESQIRCYRSQICQGYHCIY